MKLILVTPAIKASAIGRMACLVTKALLAMGHTVVVVRAESKSFFNAPTHDFDAEMIRWDDDRLVMDAATDADAIVYQIGDNFPYHEGCIRWMSELPGLVCLHDFFLGHLFHGWAEQNREAAGKLLRQWYGEEGAQIFFDPSTNPDFIARTRDIAPMTEWICSQANGVITHSKWGTPRVIRSCPGPVKVVPLAYDAPGGTSVVSTPSHNHRSTFRLLTIGHINPNKRVASVIRAIGSSPILRAHCVYRLVGHIQSAAVIQLSALASSLRVNLVVTGEADDDTLADAVAEADVVSCLRWPSLEAASASAIEAMLYGKATVVTDTGFYHELPDGCVEKISHVNEVSNVRASLERLFADRVARTSLGTHAKKWANSTYSAHNYAVHLIDLSELCISTLPLASSRKFFKRVMNAWGASEALLQNEGLLMPPTTPKESSDFAIK
jgi:glycosyltransferase involved in cell wall biosynthesis